MTMAQLSPETIQMWAPHAAASPDTDQTGNSYTREG